MNSSEIENLSLYIDWIMSALKTQDQLVTETFKSSLNARISTECARAALILALYQLAETHMDVCIWALHNYDAQLHLELQQNTVNYSVRHLLNQGFVLGKDFSSYSSVRLLIHADAKAFLLKDAPPLISLILRETLTTLESNLNS